MDPSAVITSILALVAGAGIFLIACSMMSASLGELGGDKLKSLFQKAPKSKLVGVGVGAATAAAVQSSSATSVMVIGFADAGIMSLTQAATVIFGANIGTTVTGQLVAFGTLGGESLSASVIFGALTGIGAFVLLLSKRDKTKNIGGLIAGFGMLFVGLSMMSGAMECFAAVGEVKGFLAMLRNPVLLVLAGAALTAIVQSSSIMTSMTITMTVAGLISLNQGIYITMGANIGTCVTGLLAGLTSAENAKRLALIHFLFNFGGVLLFLIAGLLMSIGNIDYGTLFEKLFPNTPQIQLAMFHTIFNVVTVTLILPFTEKLVGLATRLVPERGSSLAKSAVR